MAETNFWQQIWSKEKPWPTGQKNPDFDHDAYINNLPEGVRKDMEKGKNESFMGNAALFGLTYAAVRKPGVALELLGMDPTNFNDQSLYNIDARRIMQGLGGRVRGAKNVLNTVETVVRSELSPKVALAGADGSMMSIRNLDKTDQITSLGKGIKKGKIKPPDYLHDWSTEIAELVNKGKLTRAPNTRFEAIALGTNKFDDTEGINRMIRRFRSEKLPLGRTEQTVLRPKQRGMTKRLNLEEMLTLGKDKGFYLNTPTGSHAHHWNPLAVLGKVTDGMPKKTREAFLKSIQDELGLFSGNHIGNLRQLPSEVHTKLHQTLDRLGYNPQKIKSFKGKSIEERFAFMEQFNQNLMRVEEEMFTDVMKYKHGKNWAPKP